MIRGTKRPMAPTAKQTLELRAAIHNRFDIEVRDAATGELMQRAQAFNLICETLWDRLLATGSNNAWSPATYFNYICFGSGSGTPSASDTTLFSQLGSKAPSNYTLYSDVAQIANGLVYAQSSIRLNAEEYVGDTLTEVGIAYDATHIVTHAMLQDMNGNPISIEKAATDVIDIYATVYIHFPAGGWYNGSVTVAESDQAIVDKRFFIILTGRSTATGNIMYCSNASKRTGENSLNIYTGMNPVINRSNKTVSMSARIAAGDFNLPIRAILIESLHKYYGSDYRSPAFWMTMGGWFTPPAISSEAVGTGDGTTTGFATAFPVKTAGTVYVDGVAATGVTMRTGPADVTHLENWMNACYKTAAGTPGYYPRAYPVEGGYLSIESLAAGEKSDALENPFYALGIAEIQCRIWSGTGSFKILASDDLVNWSETSELTVSANWATYQIPQAMRNKRYWVFQNTGAGGYDFYAIIPGNAPDMAHNIVFSSPPAAGAVITADYTPDCIAKDENHVFDLNMVLTLGEYQEV